MEGHWRAAGGAQHTTAQELAVNLLLEEGQVGTLFFSFATFGCAHMTHKGRQVKYFTAQGSLSQDWVFRLHPRSHSSRLHISETVAGTITRFQTFYRGVAKKNLGLCHCIISEGEQMHIVS